MGEARRRKLSGHTDPNPNWRRPLTSEEIKEAVTKGVVGTMGGVISNWNKMNKNKNTKGD